MIWIKENRGIITPPQYILINTVESTTYIEQDMMKKDVAELNKEKSSLKVINRLMLKRKSLHNILSKFNSIWVNDNTLFLTSVWI